MLYVDKKIFAVQKAGMTVLRKVFLRFSGLLELLPVALFWLENVMNGLAFRENGAIDVLKVLVGSLIASGRNIVNKVLCFSGGKESYVFYCLIPMIEVAACVCLLLVITQVDHVLTWLAQAFKERFLLILIQLCAIMHHGLYRPFPGTFAFLVKFIADSRVVMAGFAS